MSDAAALLEQYLAERDVTCPLCGYNLRGLRGGRCPECGQELALQVGLVEPRFAAYLATVTAFCAGLGGSGVLAVVGAFNAPGSWWRFLCARVMLAQVVYCLVIIPILLAKRRQFRKLEPRRQRVIAIWSWIIVVATFVTIVATFRG